jgi:hypothetical protein
MKRVNAIKLKFALGILRFVQVMWAKSLEQSARLKPEKIRLVLLEFVWMA